MLVNANIKSKKELAQRLIDGEVFYSCNGSKIFFDESEYETPFRFMSDPLMGLWEEYLTLKKELNWWDNIPEEGVLCWVSDESPIEKDKAKVITSYDSNIKYKFMDIDDIYWIYATPVKPEECFQHEAERHD